MAPGAKRSTHPLASFVVVGQRAQWLTEHHPTHYGMGENTPLGRLCGDDGRVLMLGVSFTNMTLLHHAEQLVDLPDKHIDCYKMPILQDGQKVWVDVEEFDTTNGIADFGVEDYSLEIGQSYIAAGRGHSGLVGSAQAYLVDADDVKTYAIDWMTQNHCPSLS